MVAAEQPGGAQQTVRVTDRITCSACRIEVIPKGDLDRMDKYVDRCWHFASEVSSIGRSNVDLQVSEQS